MPKVSVLIPYASDNGPRERLFEWVYRRWDELLAQAFLDSEICIGQVDPFNRAAARNEAYSLSTGQILVVADADTVFQVDQLVEAVRLAQMGAWVIPYGSQNYYNLSEQATERMLRLDPTADIPEPFDPLDWEFKLESWAGMLVMPRAAFEAAGKYSERFQGWAYEDNSFRLALDTLWGPHLRTQHYLCHLWHPYTHEETWGQPHFQENQALYREYQMAAGDPDRMRRLVG